MTRERRSAVLIGAVAGLDIALTSVWVGTRSARPAVDGAMAALSGAVLLLAALISRSWSVAHRRALSDRDEHHAVLRALQEGLLVVRDGELIEVNDRFCRMVDMPRSLLIGARAPMPFWPSEDTDSIEAALARFLAEGEDAKIEMDFARADGSRFPVRLTAGLAHVQGRLVGSVTAVRDITDERLAADELAAQRDFAGALLGALSDGYVFTRNGRIEEVNGEVCRLTGFSREELIGCVPPYPFWPDGHFERAERTRASVVAAGGGAFELELRRKDGVHLIAALTARPARDPAGHTIGFLSTVRDVTAQRKHEFDLAHDAGHDTLTGLPNRRTFELALAEHLDDLAFEGRSLCLAVLDVDHFKSINDQHGHPVGDEVLRGIAARLRRQARGGDLVARLGGEEFGWLIVDALPVDAMYAVQRACASVASEALGGIEGVTLSGGVCEAGLERDGKTLVAHADRLLYEAKRSGRDQVVADFGLPLQLRSDGELA